MIQFSNNNIYIRRGDTGKAEINFSRNVDSAVFSVKKRATDTKYIMQKDITNGILKFDHSDTNNLDDGRYVYDIQVTYDDVVDTPLSGDFVIVIDITRE